MILVHSSSLELVFYADSGCITFLLTGNEKMLMILFKMMVLACGS